MNTDNWLGLAFSFNEGFGIVRLNGKWNFLGKDGIMLSDVWLDDIRPFYNGFAHIKLNNKWLNIDKEGVLHEY